MEELTKLQECSLNIIDGFLRQNGERPPTRRELMNLLCQKSINGVNQILTALAKKGFIKIDPPRKKRNILLIKRHNKQFTLFEDNDSRVTKEDSLS